MSRVLSSYERRKLRIRGHLRSTNSGKLRLSAVKTNRHLYLQLIDDVAGATLVFASTNSNAFRAANADTKTWCNVKYAVMLGRMFGSAASKNGVDLGSLDVYFDRGASPYVGVIKALADGVRECGVRF